MIYIIYTIWIILEVIIISLLCIVAFSVGYFIREKFCIHFERWKIKRRNKRWKKEHAKLVQQWHEEQERERERDRRIELYRAEKRRYPLFYWKEGII